MYGLCTQVTPSAYSRRDADEGARDRPRSGPPSVRPAARLFGSPPARPRLRGPAVALGARPPRPSSARPDLPVTESARVERRLGWVTVNGQRYPREKAADWLDAVQRGLCPFCGEGPFVVVAIHVAAKHDVDRLRLRSMLGVDKKESICDPAHSDAFRARMIEFRHSETGAAALAEAAAARGDRRRASWARENERRDAEILRRFDAGQTFRDIAADLELSWRTVRSVVRRDRTDEDGRRRITSRRREHFRALQAEQSQRALARRRELRTRFQAGESVAELSLIFGVSERRIKRLLIEVGVAEVVSPERSAAARQREARRRGQVAS